MKSIDQLVPANPIHPGEILRDELKSRTVKQRELSDQIGIAYSQFNEVLKGKRPVSIHLALLLEWKGIGSAEYWTNAQRVYDLDVAKKSFDPPGIRWYLKDEN